ncbi:MAG: TauD/TfdA family dioxygenase [Myxococcales bacterium]|nr:TauD/TfdA family dioxygenase [Myxococcales bacterium]
MAQTLAIHPIEGATLGAIVTGVELRNLSDERFETIKDAWHQHGVLIFREQFLSDDEQEEFSRRFGSLERLSTERGDRPDVALLVDIRPNGKSIEPQGPYALFLLGNTFWHADRSFKTVPAKACLLSARTVPDVGGETEWADMRAAYDVLNPSDREEIEDAVGVHSYRYSQELIGGTDVLSDEGWEALPPVEHPIVRTHPATGRKYLFIGRHTSHILGRDVEESRAILNRLTEEAATPPRVFSHTWRAGDIAIWDNRCVLHRARSWPSDQTRVMARTTVAGENFSNTWTL